MSYAALLLSVATMALPDGACRVAIAQIGTGEILDHENTRAAVCDRTRPNGLVRYDRRSGVARALTALAPGDAIGRLWLPDRPEALRGSRLRITARLGAVSVSREVTALQAARAGQRFFALGDDGAIFVAPGLRVAGR